MLQRRSRHAVAALTIGVAASMVIAYVVLGPGSTTGRRADVPAPTNPGTASVEGSGPSPSTRQTSPPTPRPVQPSDGTLHIASRYLSHNQARRIGWSDVISRGKPFPRVSARCSERWRASDKDSRLNWQSVDFLCLDALGNRGFKPQGIAGSATTQRYPIGARPAVDRNIVLISWYARTKVPGLVAPNHAGESVTQLMVLDLDQRRYNVIELVKPDGPEKFRNLNSHGSGLAWTGQYLYSSSHSKLWMYNADDLLEISGRFVLPAVSKWTTEGRGGLSSISLDRSTTPHRLQGINYSRQGQAYLHSFDLADSGLITEGTRGSTRDLVLRNQFGEKGRVAGSASASKVPGTSFQGVGSLGPFTFANSSALRTRETAPRVDATVVLKHGTVLDSIRMPEGNGESVYIDRGRRRYLSMVEGGAQFFFAIPLEELIKTAARG